MLKLIIMTTKTKRPNNDHTCTLISISSGLGPTEIACHDTRNPLAKNNAIDSHWVQ